MNYNDIHNADDLSAFLVELMSPDTKYALYRDIKRFDPQLMDHSSDPSTDPDEMIDACICYVMYTAGWNMAHNMTGSETGGND